ncbi:V-type ATP synthase subunit A [Pyrodictium delaneyi]|uniref:A-type ATP synthase subunit A n=1 Tax=Pyrodictium delaneyi TaxID=1273541 RepID=A0A0P0N3U0_9CREN|nr:V-type ATP synthase subunit A [Pyrodictium delaneyi]ALL01378.1 V-type ATP synthase subunit A [Pyrodictium delaneyi]
MRTVKGVITWISGPVVRVEGARTARLYEVAEVGEERLLGEVVALEGGEAVVQVYEDTSGLRPGDPAYFTGALFSVELGPGLLSTIFDGVQRPLPLLAQLSGPWIKRGLRVEPLPRNRRWHFTPSRHVALGDRVGAGDILGIVEETSLVRHYVMIPPGVRGRLRELAVEGDYRVDDVVAVVENNGKRFEVKLVHRWPVRRPRPFRAKKQPSLPLVTGVRVIDTFFPVALGGTAAIPGGFGTGKTVLLQTLASWSRVDIVVHVGCGERGNEMTELLERFPKLRDPATGKPLMERTVLIANTSNMPVAAREASIYTGITIAEYYRDMGYHVLLTADSTSRWAEALREVSARLEEIPGEEGYPAYLSSRLAGFYERAGRVECLGKPQREGSLTVIGSVSPPGGDYSEPVTSHTLRYVGSLWALDTQLAYSRHYPAINWLLSYSVYVDRVKGWWERIAPRWSEIRSRALEILQREASIRELARVIGVEALSEEDKLVLLAAWMLREGFLQQNAFHPVDAFSSPEKQVKLLSIILEFYDAARAALRENPSLTVDMLKKHALTKRIVTLKREVRDDELDKIDELAEEVVKEIEKLKVATP